jgi:hypothetical protein
MNLYKIHKFMEVGRHLDFVDFLLTYYKVDYN